ncbi:MAG: ferredoxin-type protein NapF [Desulfobulbaceae bacterium]|nr:ferredoxin-type protein NapF [Desulfobulbaceae bacterium]
MNMVSRFFRQLFGDNQADATASLQAHGQTVQVESVSRRHFLRGGKPLPIRPPWSLPEDEFLKVCSGCAACIEHCPQRLLVSNADGLPVVDFMQGECTFCGECAANCAEGALSREGGVAPWRLKARVGNGCLAKLGTFCRSCGELCEVAAIRFRPQVGGPVSPEIDDSLCNGCGACFQVCPVRAIRIV